MIYQTRSELLYKIMCYKDVVEDAYADHIKIIEALKSEDRCRCVEAMMSHLDDVSQNIDRLGIHVEHI